VHHEVSFRESPLPRAGATGDELAPTCRARPIPAQRFGQGLAPCQRNWWGMFGARSIWTGARLAALLVDLRVTPRTKVVWRRQNSAELLLAARAVREDGAVGVPLSYRFSPPAAAYVVDNGDAKVVVVHGEYVGVIVVSAHSSDGTQDGWRT
jgi:hypothetical protein